MTETKKRNPPMIRDNTPEEEAEIRRQIAKDPDTWSTASDAQIIKRKAPVVRDSTPERDAEIRAQIAADPDMWETPLDAPFLKRGRPMGESKQQVTIRLDKDVLQRLKAGGKGWQTRLNALLRESMGM